jgi:hypothetical protein
LWALAIERLDAAFAAFQNLRIDDRAIEPVESAVRARDSSA